MPNKNAWWKPAIEIFGQVSLWIVLPIILALVVGKNLDAHYNTRPWIFLGLSGVGFLITLFGLVRTIRIYIKKIEKDGKTDEPK